MKANNVMKVARDIYIEQMKWSSWFIGIMIAVYIGLNIARSYFNFDSGSVNNLFMFSAGSSMIYMFVIGIIAGASFLPQLFKLGITRKTCFYAMMVAAFYLSVSLPLIFILLSLVESLFTGLLQFNVAFFVLYVFSILVMYILGWMINVGFYKFNWMAGLVFVAFAIFMDYIYVLIWSKSIVALYDLDMLLSETFEMVVGYSNSSFLTSSLQTLLLTAIILTIIRLLTRNMPIKIK
ncbi:hypothetical protein [Sedimentibacter sp.]|uniref:hypothetical protein n=1 Tax=Sedimentibacter sp. TaxID=1960295 RepID=UPI0028A2603B|nr:hypothetical protein [Sedimentibacter sp.]